MTGHDIREREGGWKDHDRHPAEQQNPSCTGQRCALAHESAGNKRQAAEEGGCQQGAKDRFAGQVEPRQRVTLDEEEAQRAPVSLERGELGRFGGDLLDSDEKALGIAEKVESEGGKGGRGCQEDNT